MENTGKPQCGSIGDAVKVIGDKWSSLLIRELTAGPKRFSELEQALGIGPRTLSQRLDSLESQSIIEKTTESHAAYNLTAKGEDLLPVLRSMAEWCTKYDYSCKDTTKPL